MEQHRVLCYGDSNTYGYDPRFCLGGRRPKSIRWTALLEADGWNIFNEGQNGRCIPQRDWEIAAVVQKIHQVKSRNRHRYAWERRSSPASWAWC